MENSLSRLLAPVAPPLAGPTPTLPQVMTEAKVAPQVVISRQEVADALALAVANHYGFEGRTVVEPLAPWGELMLDGTHWELELRALPSTVSSRMLLSGRLLTDTEDAFAFQVPVRCEHWMQVRLAERNLVPGEPLLEDDFTLQERDLVRLLQPVMPASAELDNLEVAQAVSEGQPLLWRQVGPKPLIRRGQPVEAIADDGLLQVRLKAIAQENGQLGEVITVRNPTSLQNFHAEILDNETVLVHF